MRVAVIGTGYVGLVAGACFADSGNDVICVDIDERKLEMLRKGEIPIYEPGLEGLVERNIAEKRLSFTSSYEEAVGTCDIVFLAVGTPPLPNGEPDLSFLKAAAEQVAKSMTGYRIIVNKSTVPIGSHRVVADWMNPHTKHPFDVASNPEFLKEGTAVDDFLKPDRVVLGTEKESVYKALAELYAPFVRQGNPVIWMDPVSAEITKYACNSFLATRISFMNELAVLCEKVGGDVEKVRIGMSTDIRIGRHFLYAGVGYGGSCFPKDVQALMATGRREDVPLSVITAAEEANARQKRHIVSRVRKHFGGNLSGKTFAIWGLAFKPNTDDMREAPALVIIDELVKVGAKTRVFDPVSMENARQTLKDKATFCKTYYETLEGADALVLVTEWNEFRNPDFKRVKQLLKQPVIFDGRNIFNPASLRQQGFTYYGVGR
ncbi:MAG: UDP-glucose 6-dehydrogenase [Bdellovibrionales bacterium RIFOXYD1_FULL_53_11]|nr:MAG: UDP-glucose 6-dehydrogenase [Bdellovibrionales bacterium RIFOXYD1_FULL_53_11]